MHHDRRGVPVTSANAAAVASFDQAVRGLLAHRRDASDHLATALGHDPDLALGHCFTGFALLLLGQSEQVVAAREAAARAEAAMAQRGATLRERRLCQALRLWLGGEMEHCATTIESILAADKLDAFAFKLLHAIHFILGDATAMLRVAEGVRPAWRADIPDGGFIHGCRAFALEETGALAAAERCGRDAIALEGEDVWAAHAVAHVYGSWHRPDAGIAWLKAFEPALASVNNLAGHLYWHEALCRLVQDDTAAALALYDQKIRPTRTDDYRDLTNAGSLLWRLERAGRNVGDRWQELADLAERRSADNSLVFAQLNYLLCLVGAGRSTAAGALFERMRRWAMNGTGTQARRAAAIGVPLGQHVMRVLPPASSDQAAATALRESLGLIGGSHAQRGIFELILDDAASQPAQVRQHSTLERSLGEKHACQAPSAALTAP